MNTKEREREQRARLDPICQQFREISLKLSYLLRHRLKEGWEYHRKPTNSYGITLRRKRTTYDIWWCNNSGLIDEAGKVDFTRMSSNPLATVICIDRRSRASRGITTDANLKIIQGPAKGEGAIQQTLEALEKEGVIRKLS